jgi:geranylgeranyl transferase type-2 subunit beta
MKTPGNPGYLVNLTAQLVDGLAAWPQAKRETHARWLVANQNPDGGFSGREGGSDLYYTGFALRGLAVLQGLTEEVCERAGKYLQSQLNTPASVIDLFSLLVGSSLVQLGGYDVFAKSPTDWPVRVAGSLAGFRTPDGGYGQTPGQAAGSTYHSFLVALLFQLIEQEIPEPNALAAFVRTRARPDGGFVEAPAMRRCGTNPTAAGAGLLQILGEMDEETALKVVAFLRGLPSALEGGYRANDRIPSADLLSSFTACWTLKQLGHEEEIDKPNIRTYAIALENKSGGFQGGLWDAGLDVEYTFYGLGTLAVVLETEKAMKAQ